MCDYWDSGYPADLPCYTPKEFNKITNQIIIIREAVKKGIKL